MSIFVQILNEFRYLTIDFHPNKYGDQEQMASDATRRASRWRPSTQASWYPVATRCSRWSSRTCARAPSGMSSSTPGASPRQWTLILLRSVLRWRRLLPGERRRGNPKHGHRQLPVRLGPLLPDDSQEHGGRRAVLRANSNFPAHKLCYLWYSVIIMSRVR